MFSRVRYSGEVRLNRSWENCRLVTRRLKNTTSSLPWLALVEVGVVRYLSGGGAVVPEGSAFTELKPLPRSWPWSWSRTGPERGSCSSLGSSSSSSAGTTAGSSVGSSTGWKSPEWAEPGVDATPEPAGGAGRASGPGTAVTAMPPSGACVSPGRSSRRLRAPAESWDLPPVEKTGPEGSSLLTPVEFHVSGSAHQQHLPLTCCPVLFR